MDNQIIYFPILNPRELHHCRIIPCFKNRVVNLPASNPGLSCSVYCNESEQITVKPAIGDRIDSQIKDLTLVKGGKLWTINR